MVGSTLGFQKFYLADTNCIGLDFDLDLNVTGKRMIDLRDSVGDIVVIIWDNGLNVVE